MYHVNIMALTVAQLKKFNIIPHFSATRPLEINALDPPSVCPFGGSQSAYHLSFVLGRMRFFCLLLKIGKCLRKNTNNKINIKNTKNVGKENLSVGIFFFTVHSFRCTLKDGIACGSCRTFGKVVEDSRKSLHRSLIRQH